MILMALIIGLISLARTYVVPMLRLDQIGVFSRGIPSGSPHLFDELINLFVGLSPLHPLLECLLILPCVPRGQICELLINLLYFLSSKASLGIIVINRIIGQPPDLQRVG